MLYATNLYSDLYYDYYDILYYDLMFWLNEREFFRYDETTTTNISL